MFFFFLLFCGEQCDIGLSCLLLRATWRATCTAVEWPTRTLQTLWSSSEWRATWPQGSCTSTNTTLYTGNSIPVIGNLVIFVSVRALWRRRIQPPNASYSPVWSPPATTSWCCLSNCQKNSSISDFVAGGWTPLTLPLLFTKTVASRYKSSSE